MTGVQRVRDQSCRTLAEFGTRAPAVSFWDFTKSLTAVQNQNLAH